MTRRTKKQRVEQEEPSPSLSAPAPSALTVEQLVALEPLQFHREMLARVLLDLEAARAKGSLTAVHQLAAHAVRLRTTIAEAEETLRVASTAAMTTDELVTSLVDAILALPDALFDRVESAVHQRRTGKPRMRVVPS